MIVKWINYIHNNQQYYKVQINYIYLFVDPRFKIIVNLLFINIKNKMVWISHIKLMELKEKLLILKLSLSNFIVRH